MIQYSLPDITRHLPLNLMIRQIQRTAPEMFFDDVDIDCVYGNFPGCIMNGGRHIVGERYTYDQLAETFDRIAAQGLITRLTLTNILIRPEQFEDEYSNMILKAAQGRNVEVIVCRDELDDYVSARYHFRRILSTSRALSGVDELNRMLDRYDMVVLDYNHNKDDEYLKKVKDPSRLEVMPNEMCKPGCPVRQQHYEYESRCQLEHKDSQFAGCPCSAVQLSWPPPADSPTLLTNEEVRRLHSTYRISNFKIVGRQISVQKLMTAYFYYLVRPEYCHVLSDILLKKLT